MNKKTTTTNDSKTDLKEIIKRFDDNRYSDHLLFTKIEDHYKEEIRLLKEVIKTYKNMNKGLEAELKDLYQESIK